MAEQKIFFRFFTCSYHS